MGCPSCGQEVELRPGAVSGTEVEVDHCPACQGYWFDEGELGTLLGPLAPNRVSLSFQARRNEAKRCPRCDLPLAWFCYPGTTTVVDVCERCRGLWLDGGEGKRLRQSLGSPRMVCPRCRETQPDAASCAFCGVVVERWRKGHASASPRPEAMPESYMSLAEAKRAWHPRRLTLKERLLRYIDDSLARLRR